MPIFVDFLEKSAIFCNFCADTMCPNVRHFEPEIAQNRRNSGFLGPIFKKSAIFCNFCAAT